MLEEKQKKHKDNLQIEKKASKSKRKILIADDDKFLSTVLLNKLKKRNFDVVLARDGEEAIEKIKSEKPNLVLLDIIMPKKDGFDVLEETKEDKQFKKTPFVIISNLGQSNDIERAEKLGAIDFLVKSNLSLNDVVDKVREYVVRYA